MPLTGLAHKGQSTAVAHRPDTDEAVRARLLDRIVRSSQLRTRSGRKGRGDLAFTPVSARELERVMNSSGLVRANYPGVRDIDEAKRHEFRWFVAETALEYLLNRGLIMSTSTGGVQLSDDALAVLAERGGPPPANLTLQQERAWERRMARALLRTV